MTNGNKGRKRETGSRALSEIFRFGLMLFCLLRSQLISLQVLSGPSASKQAFTHAIRLKTTLSSGFACVYERVHVCVCVCKSTAVSLQFAYISILSTSIFDQQWNSEQLFSSNFPHSGKGRKMNASHLIFSDLVHSSTDWQDGAEHNFTDDKQLMTPLEFHSHRALFSFLGSLTSLHIQVAPWTRRAVVKEEDLRSSFSELARLRFVVVSLSKTLNLCPAAKSVLSPCWRGDERRENAQCGISGKYHCPYILIICYSHSHTADLKRVFFQGQEASLIHLLLLQRTQREDGACD